MKAVPLVDLKRQYAPLREAMLKAAAAVVDTTAFISGPDVGAFETELARWLGVPKVTSCACATDGLHAVLRMLGVGPGDDVITTAHTAIATAEAIHLAGARVVFSDIRRDTCNLDPADVARRLTPRTRAIIAVHLYGQPADLDELGALARQHGLWLIEDCAQALGARYRGHQVGTIGDAAVFSFFPSKPLGGFGDGGALLARDPVVGERLQMFCNHGRKSKYLHEFLGMNSRLDTLQAALLRLALPHLDEWNAARRRLAARYAERLAGIPGLELPVAPAHVEPVWHVYAVRVPDREALAAHLKRQGIGSGVHYPSALNVLPAFAHLRQGAGCFPVAEDHCARTLSLPMFPVMTDEEQDAVCAAVRQFYCH